MLDTGRDRRLRTFIHHGMTDEQVVEIGELPSGHGLLGLIIDRPEPLRLHDLTPHPASYGVPPDHPPMSRSSVCPCGSATRCSATST